MRGLAEEYGVKYAAVGPDVDLPAESARLWDSASHIWWIGFLRVMQFGAKLVEKAYPDVLALCRTAELVVVNDCMLGAAEADKLGIPWVSVTLQPLRAPVFTVHGGGLKKRLTDLFWKFAGGMMVAPINAFRKRVGAPTVKDIVSMGVISERLLLLPVSPTVVPADPRWLPFVKTTGYWYPEIQPDWHPPDALVEFLNAGPKPVVICLGAMSMSGGNAIRAAEIALDAVRRTGVRAVIQGWDSILRGHALPVGVFHAGPVPHGWLLEHASGIVHHGGAGTTAAGLRAGIPSLIIPHIIDQFYWARRVEALGAGPVPIPRPKLTAEKLAGAIRQMAEDEAMRGKAAEAGRRIRAEGNGVERAVRFIEEAAGRNPAC
jgi:UDP:flavonoid glycosyltransferase YjiC (YdhE family)